MNPNSFNILTRNGIADAGQDASIAIVVQRLEDPNAKLLLHLHGGLVDEAAGLSAATRLSGSCAQSWKLGPEWTQVYVIWRTGAFETLRANWTDLVHDDRLYQTLLRKLIGFVSKRLGVGFVTGRSTAAAPALSDAEIQKRILGLKDSRAPFAELDARLDEAPLAPDQGRGAAFAGAEPAALAVQFQGELAGDPAFAAAVGDLERVVNEKVPGRAALAQGEAESGRKSLERLDGDIRAEIQPVTAAGTRALVPVPVGAFIIKHAAQVALRCFRRFAARRDHGVHATIVEEICREFYGDLIGAKVWGMMVKDAADHFADGALGARLVQALGVTPGRRISVTAHSAGAIWASRMLKALHASGASPAIDLYLLAPAVRQSLFAEMLQDSAALVDRCRMFTMEDALERADAVLGHDKGYIYPSSLLYLVSGLFEEKDSKAYADAPLLGMLRYSGAAWLEPGETKDAQAAAAFFQQPDKAILKSITKGVTEADSHGGFDEDPATLASVRALLR